MARPASWLPRLHEIRRAVSNSVRSHYTRRELESLFELQPRAAQKLLELFPTVAMGTSRLVEREAILKFLDGVRDADDTTAYFERVRLAKAAVSHKKIRTLVRRDTSLMSLTSLPEAIQLTPGRLEVNFKTVEQLAEAMYALARVLESDGDNFTEAFEPKVSRQQSVEADEMKLMLDDLVQREADWRGRVKDN